MLPAIRSRRSTPTVTPQTRRGRRPPAPQHVLPLRSRSRAPAGTTPTTYVVCDADRAIAPALQERMAARAGTVHHLPTGHSPFLAAPAAVARIVRDVVAGVA